MDYQRTVEIAVADFHDSDATISLRELRGTVERMIDALSVIFKESRDAPELRIKQADSVLRNCSEAIRPVGQSVQTAPAVIRGGLAEWQIKRVKRYVEQNLTKTIRTQELAGIVKLSSFHFSRAFRASVLDSPHTYVMRRRVERARVLMLTTRAPLCHIAVDCGLADQAHFNRLFRKFVGESPGAWRRMRGEVIP